MISVIMPVYNGENYLREAIDSILNQTYTDFEFIIINDCSTDSTEEIIKSYSDERIVYIKNVINMGVANTLNRGLDIAKGKYIARMDADDISLPKRLEKQYLYMEKHRDIDVLATQVLTFGAREYHSPTSVYHEALKVDLLFNTCLCHPTVMLRGTVFGKGGIRYDNNFNKLEDYELWSRICEDYKFACYDEILFKYRLHENQVTQNYGDELLKQYSSLKGRTLLKLGITKDQKGFDEFLNRCLGNSITTEYEKENLRYFCEYMYSQNDKFKVYDKKLLACSLRAIVCSTFDDKLLRQKYFRQHKEWFNNSIKEILRYLKFAMV